MAVILCPATRGDTLRFDLGRGKLHVTRRKHEFLVHRLTPWILDGGGRIRRNRCVDHASRRGAFGLSPSLTIFAKSSAGIAVAAGTSRRISFEIPPSFSVTSPTSSAMTRYLAVPSVRENGRKNARARHRAVVRCPPRRMSRLDYPLFMPYRTLYSTRN